MATRANSQQTWVTCAIIMDNKPGISKRQLFMKMELVNNTVWTILRKEMNLYPYEPKQLTGLPSILLISLTEYSSQMRSF
jgi:hypothetical protein